jgi:hypothetical protein
MRRHEFRGIPQKSTIQVNADFLKERFDLDDLIVRTPVNRIRYSQVGALAKALDNRKE